MNQTTPEDSFIHMLRVHQCGLSAPHLLALCFVLDDDFIRRLWLHLLLFLLVWELWRVSIQLHLSLQLVCTGLVDKRWMHEQQKTMKKPCL